jgi:hypothetical protein
MFFSCNLLLVGFRARVLRAGGAGAPSTPGGLGYLAAEWLMDLGQGFFFQSSGIYDSKLFLFFIAFR